MIFKYKIRNDATRIASPIFHVKIRSYHRTKSGLTTLTVEIPQEEQWMMDLAAAIINDEKEKIPDRLTPPEFIAFVRFCKEFEMCKILGPQGESWLSKMMLLSGTFETLWIHLELGNVVDFYTSFSRITGEPRCVDNTVVDFMGRKFSDYRVPIPCIIAALKIGRLHRVKLVATDIKKFIDDTNRDLTPCYCDGASRSGCRNARIGQALSMAMHAGIAAAVFAPEEKALKDSEYDGAINNLLNKIRAAGANAETSVSALAPYLGAMLPQRCMCLDDLLQQNHEYEVAKEPDFGENGQEMWNLLKDNKEAAAAWSTTFRKED